MRILLLTASLVVFPAWAEVPMSLERMVITTLTHLPDQLPEGAQQWVVDELGPSRRSVADLLNSVSPAITISEAQGNPFQPELSYRGYAASPLLGLPQGLAFYQNGARINEPFGDTMNFELVPQIAVSRIALIPGANPLLGLNALGGSVLLEMKDGFSHQDSQVLVEGGSFDRQRVGLEAGREAGQWGAYGAVAYYDEAGWRDASPSRVHQLYGDIGRRGSRSRMNISLTHAKGELNGNGAAPAELLAADRRAVFTFPDVTDNALTLLQASLDYFPRPATTLNATMHLRHFDQRTLNGDETDIDRCQPPLPQGFLCGDEGEGPVLVQIDGARLAEEDVGQAPYGVYNRSRTQTRSGGVAVQWVQDLPWGRRWRQLVVGATLDASRSDFATSAEPGELTAERTVSGSGLFLAGDVFQTGLESRTRHLSAFAGLLFSLGEQTELTLSARYGRSMVDLQDQIGDALTGRHHFDRVNPAIELAHGSTDDTGRWFIRYAENNRIPTPAELSCADPEEPCRFPNAFIADPPLEQVAARTAEVGLRRQWQAAALSLTAHAGINRDDIIFVSSGPVIGSGYFRNAGDTRRTGLDLDFRLDLEPLTLAVGYAWLDATFRDRLILSSAHNPSADERGEITVRPGDRLPLLPRHSGRIELAWEAGPWRVQTQLHGTSGRVLRGDEANQQPPLPGFVQLDLGAELELNSRVNLYVDLQNLLDREYATFGTFGDTEEVFLREAPNASDPRFITPAAPRALVLGLRIRL